MSSTIHVRCGADIRDGLRAGGIAGAFLEWADPVCQGPVLPLPEPDYLERRRAWLSACWDIPRAELDAKLRGVSELPEQLADHDEICLWFEHDLYDQSILVQLLAELAGHPQLHARVRIVSIDRHVELRRFIGLGQLRPEQLAALFPKRHMLAPEAYELAVRAWDAWREPTPDRLRDTDWSSHALPFLAGAIDRHLQEFPAARDGLGLTQRLTLQAIADGSMFAAQVFGRLLGELDPAPWLGDLMFWAYLRELADGPAPLITMVGEFPSEQLALTEHGRQVLSGNDHWLDSAGPPKFGPSRWRGGVEIVGYRG